ncbi:MAG: hypothetical protein Q4C42_09800 [Clostridia bacterium]|nr:hypothetical protein [Clostridia bacterium]
MKNTLGNPNLLKGRMAAYGITQTELARKLYRSSNYVSQRVSKHEAFTTQDMYTIGEILAIPKEELLDFFPKL